MITRELVLKIAKLAHLEVAESELPKLTQELEAIFSHFSELEKVDVSNVEPMSHVQSGVNVFREDQIQAGLDIEDALKNTPDVSGRFIRVPIIIESNTEH